MIHNRMYGEIASWFHLLTAPEEYAEEAEIYRKVLQQFVPNATTMLELGSGGGNNASHLKKHFAMTLVDLSPEMLELSRGLNPDLEHLQGDMRTVRLERLFDVVFIHDAISYMTSLDDLRLAVQTAFVHCQPSGVVLLVPDDTRETFKPTTECGGHDGSDRSMRYLEWKWDPDPSDSTYLIDYAYLLREADGSVRALTDRHTCGLFSRVEWLAAMQQEGFQAQILPFEHSEVEPDSIGIFLGIKKSSG
ncbi:MAG: class I SAM-dependent methyltransferase [Anaerolineaceae bacterium]|nr:class I SAM-dependent methyltransferase [Anaerolineaceae bacterium]